MTVEYIRTVDSAGMLLAQGSEGEKWIQCLPGHDVGYDPGSALVDCDGGVDVTFPTVEHWWGKGASSASLFERECDKAAKRTGWLFETPPVA